MYFLTIKLMLLEGYRKYDGVPMMGVGSGGASFLEL
jgi:hypothetical protein